MFLSHPHHPIHAREIRSLALLALVIALSVLTASELHGATDRSRLEQRPPPTTANEGFDALTLWQVLKSQTQGGFTELVDVKVLVHARDKERAREVLAAADNDRLRSSK